MASPINVAPVVKPSIVRYDVFKDFAPIATVASSPFVLIGSPKLGAAGTAELIAAARQAPGKLNYGTDGVGTSMHLTAEIIKLGAGVDIVHVPYKGTGLSIPDAVSGQIKIIFGNIISAGPHVASGSLRGLAITGLKRSSSFPDLPTVAEAGVPGYEASVWFGVFATAGTPKPIVERLHKAMQDVLSKDTVKKRLEGIGAVANLSSPADFTKVIQSDIKTFQEVAKTAGLEAK